MRASPTRLLKARRSRCSRERKAFLRRYTRRIRKRSASASLRRGRRSRWFNRWRLTLGNLLQTRRRVTWQEFVRLLNLSAGVSIEKAKANKKVSKRVLDKITWRPI